MAVLRTENGSRARGRKPKTILCTNRQKKKGRQQSWHKMPFRLRRPLPNLDRFSINIGRIRLGFVSYPFGLPCAVCKALAPVPVTQH